jgi:hypothetical protein
MNQKMLDLETSFLKKQDLLENARKVLKTEFIGIDGVIDEIMNNVGSWFMLSKIQVKPLVINLWGLTGVGKTALVNRLVTLIEFEDSYFRFDLKGDSFDVDDLFEKNDTASLIVTLDEFQNSRTINFNGTEIEGEDNNGKVWGFIDSGIISFNNYSTNSYILEKETIKLKNLIKSKVIVKNGIVVGNQKMYCEEMKEIESDDLLFVPEDLYRRIIDLSGKKFQFVLRKDVEKYLRNLSGNETILFLENLLEVSKRFKEKNFSKALIFILGNLDEAYTMSSDLSADMDADNFHKQSLKITVPKIKNSLKERFRAEQISRLGNIHIIYPALSSKAYIKIIENELKKVKLRIFKLTDIHLEFNPSVINVIYKEGVYPTQGVRPILTTISQLITSNLSAFLSEIITKKLDVNTLKFSAIDKKLQCDYYSESNLVFDFEVKLDLKLNEIRKSKKDDKQAIVAVHESGHAILSAILLKTIPEVVYSVTSDSGVGGFVHTKFSWNYISRKELIPRVAMMLGGYVAEELIFGKENLTAGASNDIAEASNFLSQMIKSNGMGDMPLNYSLPNSRNNYAYNEYKSVEKEIRIMIEQGLTLAKETLIKERKLLLEMSNYLSDHRILAKDDIEKLIEKNITIPVKFITNGKLLYYRSHLKKEIEKNEMIQLSDFPNEIVMNKEEIN